MKLMKLMKLPYPERQAVSRRHRRSVQVL